jgi:hypothetical protein
MTKFGAAWLHIVVIVALLGGAGFVAVRALSLATRALDAMVGQ